MKIVKNLDELLEVIGAKKGDTINVVTPQFEREYKLSIDFIPEGLEELKTLIETCSCETLQKMGVGKWAEHGKDNDYLKEGEIHYLFPGEWYNSIPDGFEVVAISGTKEKFKKGISDDDIRFGCLPYGFIRKI